MLLHVWLSESVGADELLLRYMRKIFDSPERKSADFTDADVLAVHDIARTVSREAHHLIQFARLRKMADGSYYAPVSPKCKRCRSLSVISVIASPTRDGSFMI